MYLPGVARLIVTCFDSAFLRNLEKRLLIVGRTNRVQVAVDLPPLDRKSAGPAADQV